MEIRSTTSYINSQMAMLRGTQAHQVEKKTHPFVYIAKVIYREDFITINKSENGLSKQQGNCQKVLREKGWYRLIIHLDKLANKVK